jgi:hypothetical protein
VSNHLQEDEVLDSMPPSNLSLKAQREYPANLLTFPHVFARPSKTESVANLGALLTAHPPQHLGT